LAEAAVTYQKVGAYRDPRLYALNVFADQFSKSVHRWCQAGVSSATRAATMENRANRQCARDIAQSILSEQAGSMCGKSRQLETAGEFIQQFTGRRSPTAEIL